MAAMSGTHDSMMGGGPRIRLCRVSDQRNAPLASRRVTLHCADGVDGLAGYAAVAARQDLSEEEGMVKQVMGAGRPDGQAAAGQASPPLRTCYNGMDLYHA